MRILIHDFAGHPFQAQLSRELGRRGHAVLHAYCGGVTTGRGDLERRRDDPDGLEFADASVGRFERYDPAHRIASELSYGRSIARKARGFGPDVVISANTPLLAQALLWRAASRVDARRIYWLQDFLGHGTRQVLSERSTLLGATAGRAWERLETELLKRSDGIIPIADDFLEELDRRGVTTPATVIHNWAPLDELELGDKDNPWSRKHNLHNRPVALYAGTLGLKHDPEHLVRAAMELQGSDGTVVVISEGQGRRYLETAKSERGLDNLLLLDYVPYETLADVLSTADVCLVLLEASAGKFSVPSKTLSYLAAGRPIVAAMPAANLGAWTICDAGAGIVTDPGTYSAFSEAVRSTLLDHSHGHKVCRAARRYAETHFDIVHIANAFLRQADLLPTHP